MARVSNASSPWTRGIAKLAELRPYAIERHGASQPQLELLSLGKGYVLFSPIDLTSGLLGTNTYPIDGYQPASTEAFLQRVVTWAGK